MGLLVSRLVTYFYSSLILPDDPFHVRCRKLVLCSSWIPWPLLCISAGQYIYWSITQDGSFSGDPRWVLVLHSIPSCTYAIATPVSFRLLKRDKSDTLRICFAWYVSISLALLLFSFLNPAHNTAELALALLGMMWIGQLPHRTLLSVVICASLPVTIYNATLGAHDLAPVVPTEATLIGGFVYHSICLSCFALVISVFVTQTAEFNKILRQSQLSVLTAIEVSQMLVTYDTAAAADVLTVYSSMQDCDGALRDAMRTIVSNLDLYRPFLPNYLLQMADRPLDGEEETFVGCCDVSSSDATVLLDGSLSGNPLENPAEPSGSPHNLIFGPELPGREMTAVTTQPSSPPLLTVGSGGDLTGRMGESTQGSPHLFAPSPSHSIKRFSQQLFSISLAHLDESNNPNIASPRTRRTSALSNSANSAETGSPRALERGNSKELLRVARLRQMGFRHYAATFMAVEIPWATLNGLEANPKDAHSRTQAFVCACIDVIEQYDGVVMSTQPHRIVCSWNAFRPCHSHEFAACTSAIAVRHRLDAEFPSAHLALASGRVLVGFVGTARVKTPVVVGSPLEDLDGLMSLSRTLSCSIVLSESVARRVRARLLLLPVDVAVLREQRSVVFGLVPQFPTPEEHQSYERRNESYLIGFSHMMNGQYAASSEALRMFIEKHSAEITFMQLSQSRRLLVLVDFLFTSRSTGPAAMTTYCRRLRAAWDDFGYIGPRQSLSTHRKLSYMMMSSTAPVSPPSALLSGSLTVSMMSPATQALTTEDVRHAVRTRLSASLDSVNGLTSEASDILRANGTEYHRSGKLLGKGATAEVFLGMQDDGSLVALKYVNVEFDEEQTCFRRRGLRNRRAGSNGNGSSAHGDNVEQIIREVNVLATLRHDDIVAYLGSAITGNHLVIIMEYVSGGSLAGALEAFGAIPLHSLRRYLSDVLSGLQYLHSHGIIHRDIKPHNVLLMIDGQCKLTDFGAAAELSRNVEGTDVTGTPLYMAPEACLGKATAASDIWSVGILTVELLTGRTPYTPEQCGIPFVPSQFVFRLGRDERLMPTLPDSLSSSARDFVSLCLCRDASRRPSAEELLKHAFLL
eukprot:PhM_4_TR11628/c1_g2_i1/m.57279/K17533/MAP3K19, YSK4; mitogen-activated protein kinase kinase kinase 19